MPFIITTTTERATARTANGRELERHERSGTRDITRHAVATLDEAKRAARDAGAYAYQADVIDDGGGTVGPLSDGTVIEVSPFQIGVPDWRARQIVNAYNEAQ